MKIICQKSGVPLHKSDLLLGFDLADEHPIFRAKTSLILKPEMVHRFMFAENILEKRLIFLAVLNASYLVTFEHPAAPSLQTMEKCFHHAMDLVQWVRFAEYTLAKIVSFPQYIIRRDNADISSIRSWLDSLEELRVKINKKELDRDKSAALMQREMEIKKELGEANAVGKAFTPKLAKWALDLCDVTIRNPDYQKWMKLLCLPLNEAWMGKLEDYMELQELLQLNLPFLEDNPQAISVMHQMNSLIRECRQGFTQFSIFNDDGTNEVSDYEILDDGTSLPRVHKVNQQFRDVPIDLPILRDYPTKLAYLIAKAKWDLSQKNKVKPIDPPIIDESSV